MRESLKIKRTTKKEKNKNKGNKVQLGHESQVDNEEIRLVYWSRVCF